MSYLGIRRVPVFRIAAICVIVLTALAVGVSDADARRKKKRAPSPPFSHIVLDVKSGKALESFKADERRYPASLTKVMTLYLLFEQMEAGQFKLDTELKVSRHAAAQPPTKLGLKPGSTIRVENAIKALVTKSANDIAVVVAEAIGGSEHEFAKMMTSKARSLGMARTVYANASGLPNPRQVTSARDQAILGRAIQWHFPRQYKYFATNDFKFRGRKFHTHNRLLGQVKGVDGIKTGYIRASGFNLLTSVRRDKRHIIAVVIGGRTSRSRDAFMRKLIREHIDEASPIRTAKRKSNGAAGAIDTDELPLPPLRPAPEVETAASATAKLAEVRPDPASGAADDDTVVTTLSSDDNGEERTADGPLLASASPADSEPVVTGTALVKSTSEDKPEAGSTAAHTPVRESSRSIGVVTAANAAPAQPRPVAVAAVATAGIPGFPAWFPYLLVAFVGCAGSFASALWQVMRRFIPRRQIA